MDPESRRPLKTRSTRWAHALAASMSRAGITPNAISATSLVFAILGGASFIIAGHQDEGAWVVFWLVGAAMIQLRLLCNLMDGMVAIEGGHKTPTGELWNEIPDRFADVILLGCAGLAICHSEDHADLLGAAAGCAAVMTAYIRAVGASLTGRHDFCGPCAKPHRMAILTLAAILTAIQPLGATDGRIMWWALAVIAIGTMLTFFRRTLRLAAELKKRES
ncbi:hypothetical protein Hhel01_04103 [Haloferula helveola]